MDPVTSFALGKLVDTFMDKFGTAVVRRWTQRRANEFFTAFLHAVQEEERTGRSSHDLNTLLKKILDDEKSSETLFDAYRHVAFAQSKIIGPRVIGILTARLILDGRMATDEEEGVFLASESMTDSEFVSAVDFITDALAKADGGNPDYESTPEGVNIKWSSEVTDSNYRSRVDEVSVAPLNLGYHLGRWGGKLEQSGLLYHDLKKQVWDYGVSHYVDESGTLTKHVWYLCLLNGAITLSLLTRRVMAIQ